MPEPPLPADTINKLDHNTNHQSSAPEKNRATINDVSENQINDAIELAKFAIASLKVLWLVILG